MIKEKLIEALQTLPDGLEIYCDDSEETGGAIPFDMRPELKAVYAYRAADGVSEWLSMTKLDGVEPLRIFPGIAFIF